MRVSMPMQAGGYPDVITASDVLYDAAMRPPLLAALRWVGGWGDLAGLSLNPVAARLLYLILCVPGESGDRDTKGLGCRGH